jgi:hypothetical protein
VVNTKCALPSRVLRWIWHRDSYCEKYNSIKNNIELHLNTILSKALIQQNTRFSNSNHKKYTCPMCVCSRDHGTVDYVLWGCERFDAERPQLWMDLTQSGKHQSGSS